MSQREPTGNARAAKMAQWGKPEFDAPGPTGRRVHIPSSCLVTSTGTPGAIPPLTHTNMHAK